MFARKMLESQLQRLGVFNVDETITGHPHLDQSFKICEYVLLRRINNILMLL